MQVIGTLTDEQGETAMPGLAMAAHRAMAEPWQRPPNDSAGDMDEMEFTADQLPAVRRCAAAYTRNRHLDEDFVGDVVIAVNEIATNAVRHGSPKAGLQMWSSGDQIIAEIHDRGTWTPAADAGATPPAMDAEGGMGLWMAGQICSLVLITTGIHGTVVHLELSAPARHI